MNYVSSPSIVILTFDMLLHDGKSFFRSPNYDKLIYLWGSMALELCLVIDEKWLRINFGSGWCCFLGVSNQKIAIVSFNMLLTDGKSFYRSQKDQKRMYLWGWMALKLCLVIDAKWPKTNFGNDWCCFLGVSNQSIVIVSFNML